jgi:hypothetical protein
MRRKEFPGAQLHLVSVLIMAILFIIVLLWMNKFSLSDLLKSLIH